MLKLEPGCQAAFMKRVENMNINNTINEDYVSDSTHYLSWVDENHMMLEISKEAIAKERWDIISKAFEIHLNHIKQRMAEFKKEKDMADIVKSNIQEINIPPDGVPKFLGDIKPYHRYEKFEEEVKETKQETWRDRPPLL